MTVESAITAPKDDVPPTGGSGSGSGTMGEGKDGATAGSSSTSSSQCTTDDLIELVRAVKFARPDASIRSVHKEISEQMSQTEGYAFLTDVKLNDVKKVWKKANNFSPGGGAVSNTGAAAEATAGAAAGATTNATAQSSSGGLKLPPQSSGDVLKLYTVGDGTISTLARNYTSRAAAAVAEAEAKDAESSKAASEEEMRKYVHFFLDVPADRSGSRPHQALINFSDNDGRAAGGGGKRGKKGKGGSKNKNRYGTSATKTEAANDTEASSDGREIVKIQVSAPLEGMPQVRLPMLLYNHSRTVKTFIHPPGEDEEGDDGGYQKVSDLIVQSGVGGALGSSGGTKGYFYCRITRRKEGDIVSVDVESGMAPVQPW